MRKLQMSKSFQNMTESQQLAAIAAAYSLNYICPKSGRRERDNDNKA